LTLLFLVSTSYGQNLNDLKELQEDLEAGGPRKPFVIFTVASVEQSLTDIGKMFEVAEREDMSDVLADLLGQIDDLKGLDRTRPVGAMFFLSDDLPPTPFPVAFVPVDDINDLIATAQLGPIKPKPVEGEKDRYEFGGNRGGMEAVLIGDYVYMTPKDRGEYLIDAELPDPATVTAGLANRFDVSLSLQIQNISPSIRTLFTTLMRTSAEAQLQQRDDELESAYKLRKANGMNALDYMEQVLRDGRQITIGLQVAEDGRQAAIEVIIDAEPDSQFADYFKNFTGKPTHFEPILSEQAPLSVSMSWKIDKREHDMFTGNIEALEALLKENLDEIYFTDIERMTNSLKATVDKEHIDGILQFIPVTEQEFVLIGGLKLTGGDSFGTGLRKVLEGVSELEAIDSVTLDVDQHQSVLLHRLEGKQENPGEERLYGSKPGLYLGSGNGIFWFGVGGDGVIPEINRSTDVILQTPLSQRTGKSAPIQAVFRMSPWLNLPLDEDNDDPIGRELTEESMKGGVDRVLMEMRPTETGGRVRIQFDEGFVKLLGKAIGNWYDQSQL